MILDFIFRVTFESCQVCRDADCTTDSLTIINNACSDNSVLSNLMSIPFSTVAETNSLIEEINSDWSFELAEMTLFQFPNTPESKSAYQIFENKKSSLINSHNLMRYCSHTEAIYR